MSKADILNELLQDTSHRHRPKVYGRFSELNVGDYALYKELIEDDKTYLYHRIRILDYNGGGEFSVQCVDMDMQPTNIRHSAIYFMPKQLSEWAPLSLQVVMSKKQVGSKI